MNQGQHLHHYRLKYEWELSIEFTIVFGLISNIGRKQHLVRGLPPDLVKQARAPLPKNVEFLDG